MTLPVPYSRRWKPLRAGLIDMFYYDVEEFRFHDGRLLLRGNNGTGKSKVLALTLPFLLDGELAAHRVEPDGDRQKRMEWNLLLGGKHPNSERTGYTWLEFGRVGDDGVPEFRTIGCGLKAVKDRGIVRHWFFVTPQRVGADLSLISPSRVPLTREKLRDAVEGAGMPYDRAADYRRAVDEALFGLGEPRYEALVNLLIQLRQPQLSKRPDERRLSDALTEALPPISPALITTVAEAFRGLDEERTALREMADAHRAADRFLGHYRRYAGIAAKRWVRAPREENSRYERLNAELKEADARYEAATAALAAAQRELGELDEAKTRLTARHDTLQHAPEMDQAKELDRLREESAKLRKFAAVREGDRKRLEAEAGRRTDKVTRARAAAEDAERTWTGAGERASADAERAGLVTEHAELIAGADGEADLAGARRSADELVARRSQAIATLEERLAAVAKAENRLRQARAEVDRLTAELQRADERIESTRERARESAADLVRNYTRYLSGATEIRVADPDEVIAALTEWTDTVDGPNPGAVAVHDAVRAATTELGRREAALTGRRDTEHATAADLEVQIARLDSGAHDAPRPPYTRDPAVREGRPGAPLWKVIDFADGVPADHRAGIEAALEAAGILDAWASPDGTLRAIDDSVILHADAVDGTACTSVLSPAIDPEDVRASALTAETVRDVLASIGLGPGARTWVAVDGRWANGVLAGSWHKPAAEHIGEGAREQARRARLAELRDQLAAVRDRIAEIDAALGELAHRQRRLDAEHRELPPDDDLRGAHHTLTAEYQRRRGLATEHDEAVATVTGRTTEVEAVRSRAAEFAGDVGLPLEADALAAVKDGVAAYRLALAALWPAAAALRTAREAAREADDELADVTARLAEAATAAAEAHQQATAVDESYRALSETAGAAVEELFRQLRAVTDEMNARNMAEEAARGKERAALTEQGKADGKRGELDGQIKDATGKRDAAIAEFRDFAATGLLAIALPDLEIPDPEQPWSARPAVELARSVNTALDQTDDGDGPWERVQKTVADEHKVLSDAMDRHGHSVGLTVRGGAMIVDVVFQGRTRTVPELAGALSDEVTQREELLSAREREILENHLLNEVAGALHELITAAEEEVGAMNTELQSRPTSTGMTLRLIWKVARKAPDGLDRVRGKLRQTVDAWSEQDRTQVGTFLQEQIAREHEKDDSAGWIEQLTRALDYRSWHEFTIQRLQDGVWRSATGPASGGERALVASVPLFAAASAHYKSAANPYAPRLIALDEAFAGVDDDSRAKCLGLLAMFDMDVVMTSEREWGCYPEVPGLAISQLARKDGIDAVLVTPWRWDGHERRRTERPVVLVPAEPPPEPSADQPELFG